MPNPRTVTITEVADPPAFFLMRSTKTLHLVRRLKLATWSDGPAWRAVEFWCDNMTNDAAGNLASAAPPEGVACARCAARHGAAELQAAARPRRRRRADAVR
jgi:hypothetical protein